MSDVHEETAAVADTTKRVYETLITTLSSVGSTWAAYGLKVGKMALVSSAETLGKTAQMLDVLATELEKKPAISTDEAAPASASTEAPAAASDNQAS
ncbi:Hypothetical protein A7982_01142 [Minicystis rosea]|nr:Hypothetical protein A7982_01142 [Minicystis rosea]